MKIRHTIPWRNMLRLGALLAIGACCVASADAQSGTNQATTTAIEPAADELLHKMSDKLTGAKQFTVIGKRTMDPALAQGRPGNLTVTFELSLNRPNKIMAHLEGKGTKRSFYYDGSHATLQDEASNVYATVESAKTIDAMLDEMHEKYGFTPPLTDFLVQDPYADLTRNVQSGREQGRESVGGVECHHLVFSQEGTDWELWLAADDFLPRKFVLTQTDMTGHPRLEAEFTKWDLNPPLQTGAFAFQPPQGAQKVEMMPLDSRKNAPAGQNKKQE